MKELTDDDLIRLYCQGDAEAFDTLFDRYHVSVYNYARTMLGNKDGPDRFFRRLSWRLSVQPGNIDPKADSGPG